MAPQGKVSAIKHICLSFLRRRFHEMNSQMLAHEFWVPHSLQIPHLINMQGGLWSVCKPKHKRYIFMPEKCHYHIELGVGSAPHVADGHQIVQVTPVTFEGRRERLQPQASVALMWLPVGKLTWGTQGEAVFRARAADREALLGFWEWRAISCLHRKKSYWKQICSPVI